MIARRSFTQWLADVLLGPRCPYLGCGYRGRGPRSLDKHQLGCC